MLLQRIKSVAILLRDADLENLARDAEETAARILKNVDRGGSSTTGMYLTEDLLTDSPGLVGTAFSTSTPSLHTLNSNRDEDGKRGPQIKNIQTEAIKAPRHDLEAQLRDIQVKLCRQRAEFEQKRLEMKRKELAYTSNLDAMVEQLKVIVTENASLKQQIEQKDAQIASLGYQVQTVLTKLSQTSCQELYSSLHAGLGTCVVRNTPLPESVTPQPHVPALRQPQTQGADVTLTPNVALFEGLDDDDVTSISSVKPRRHPPTELTGQKGSPSSMTSTSSLKTIDMLQFRKGLAALDDQIAKLRLSLNMDK
ncbi:unnamed protein product [Mesocestoides corti]|uniref:Uncharacterized protein n=2 Tax=Mesocestoides corti TaxID=53468 RepID=A0A0R3UIP3_MESCO|nr:unnamed protein product [Mesocestoides corti]